MPRAKKDTKLVKGYISTELFSKLVLSYPSLIDHHPSTGEARFRHGGISNYLTKIITRDLEIREQVKNDDPFELLLAEAKETTNSELAGAEETAAKANRSQRKDESQ